MSKQRLTALFISIVVTSSPPNLAQSQTGPNFDERWNIPSTSPAPSMPSQPTEVPNAQPPAETLPLHTRGPERGATPSTRAFRAQFSGTASFYAYTRGKTASGAPYNPRGFTAAHRTLPFGTLLRVTDPKTSKAVEVVVNDRGPAIRTRVIDLSLGAAEVLGMKDRGLASVNVEVISFPN